jgi:serine/threonine protein kinase
MVYGECPYKYPLEKEKKILDNIHDINQEILSIPSDKIKTNIERKNILEKRIIELKSSIKDLVLKEISTIDVKKTFSSKLIFRKLLDGLLREDPNKRLTATQALEDPFFNSVRSKYIEPTRRDFQPIPIKLRKISIEDIPERKWITNYTMKYVSENSDYDCYPIIFHGLDIFEKYLHHCKENSNFSTKSIGKYLNEKEVYLYLYTCFYISHKFYAITEIPLDFEDFFPEDLVLDSNMTKAEEFEEYMLSRVLNFKFFEYTLYEIAEEMINNPDASDYYKILKEYLSITQKTENYNSYRSLYREHIMKKSRMN